MGGGREPHPTTADTKKMKKLKLVLSAICLALVIPGIVITELLKKTSIVWLITTNLIVYLMILGVIIII